MKIIQTAELIERKSKAGNDYKALELTFVNGYKKLVFFENAELYMVEKLQEEGQKG